MQSNKIKENKPIAGDLNLKCPPLGIPLCVRFPHSHNLFFLQDSIDFPARILGQ